VEPLLRLGIGSWASLLGGRIEPRSWVKMAMCVMNRCCTEGEMPRSNVLPEGRDQRHFVLCDLCHRV